MKKIVYCKISMSVLLMGLLMLGMDVGPNAVPGLRPLAVWRLFSRPVVFACSLLISVLWLWGASCLSAGAGVRNGCILR